MASSLSNRSRETQRSGRAAPGGGASTAWYMRMGILRLWDPVDEAGNFCGTAGCFAALRRVGRRAVDADWVLSVPLPPDPAATAATTAIAAPTTATPAPSRCLRTR